MAMALVTTGANKPRKLRGNNFLLVLFRVTPSGNYSTGGDPLELSSLAITSKKQPTVVRINGIAGFVYPYDLANKKMKILCNTAGGANAALGEHTAAAVDAAVLADTIEGYAIYV